MKQRAGQTLGTLGWDGTFKEYSRPMKNKYFFLIIIIMTSLYSYLARADNGPRFKIFENQACTYIKSYQYKKTGTVRKLDVTCSGNQKSFAYILNGKVRSQFQTLLIWTSGKTVRGVEVLEFNEPGQFRAPKSWYKKILGHGINELFSIDSLSGATLTRESTLKLVKEALLLEADQ